MTLEEKREKLRTLLFEVKNLHEEISKEESELARSEKEVRKYDLCYCGHERKQHGHSLSVNYTDGACIECKCQHFLMT